MAYKKLVHKDPKLNDKKMWYRLVYEPMSGDWYFCTIWGPEGMISSTMHAVPTKDYDVVELPEKKAIEVSEWQMMRPVDSDSHNEFF